VDATLIRVGVIEDHPVFRGGLIGLLTEQPDLSLVGEAESVEVFIARASEACDVIVLDLHLDGLSGPPAVAAVRGRASAVLVLSASETPSSVVEAMAMGAAGYLSKHAEGTEILRAVRTVAAGQTYVSATLASYLLEAPLSLTERERAVLELLAGGETDQDISDILGISIRTVRSHLDRIRDKTGARRRAELTRLALDHGLRPRGQEG
jgi:DNA-binding NarL/FixJ family response regulator